MNRSSARIFAAFAIALATSLCSMSENRCFANANAAAGRVIVDTSDVDRDGAIDLDVRPTSGPVGAVVTILRGTKYPIHATIERNGDTTRVVVAFVGPRPARKNIGFVMDIDRIHARIDLTVPPAFAVETHDRNGAVSVRDLTGALDLETSNGAVEILHASAPIDAKTDNGSININDAGGEIHAKTDNGSIQVTHAGAGVTARTDNGSIAISGSSGAVEARSDRGNVDLTLTNPHVSNIALETALGSITLRVPPSFATPIDAHTDLGKVNDSGPQGNGPGNVRLRTNLGSISVIRG